MSEKEENSNISNGYVSSDDTRIEQVNYEDEIRNAIERGLEEGIGIAVKKAWES